MPKKLAENLHSRIIDAIHRHPEGVASSALAKTFENEISPRSLGRILNALIHEKRIRLAGETRAARYFPAFLPDSVQAPPQPLAITPAETYVPLTGESDIIRSWVRRPITQRRPVGYDRSLLDNYIPNETFYLNDADWRARLADIGRTSFAQRPAGTYARNIYNRLLIDLSWGSSRLEGNTYTQLDTANLIEHSRAAEGKDQVETQMILNHKQAIEYLIEKAGEVGFNLFTFRNLHSLLAENLLGNPAAVGRLRLEIVDISGTVYRPLAVPQQIDELFRMILAKAGAIRDPFEQAFFVMVHVPYLQPFIDVNKRVSRLAANIPFIKANLCPLSFVDVPERAYVEGTLAVYENCRVDLLRDVFTWAYERSCQQFKAVAAALPEPDPLRLKYHRQLGDAVAELVRAGAPIDAVAVRPVAARLADRRDRKRFEEMVLGDLRNLHEGNVARYRLQFDEFAAWREKQQKQQKRKRRKVTPRS